MPTIDVTKGEQIDSEEDWPKDRSVWHAARHLYRGGSKITSGN